ncbi:MAG: MarR family transcriptional regulator [Flavobacteriaceae bacterium]|nr:MarR family transcriptional regulator [Flavobacteriaceae bacterium]
MGDFAKEIKSSFPNDKVKALLNIIYTSNWINSLQVAFFKPFGLSPQQYNILRILRGANKPLKVQTIKERMIERSPNATRLMDKLREKELIERIACENDRRVVYINISSKGLDILGQIDTQNNKHPFLDNISDKEASVLSHLLDKLRDKQ